MPVWNGVTTPVEEKSCQAPFSFYFDLIDRFWKNKARVAQPLHRLCTLARKQAASFITIEDALAEQAVIEEIDALDLANGAGGTAEAVTIGFFSPAALATSIADIQEEELVGALTLINYKKSSEPSFSCSYVFEAVFRRPEATEGGSSRPLLNNFIFSSLPFDVHLRGRVFSVRGTYFTQQNLHTYRCAQANLRMALSTINPTRPFASAVMINTAAQTASPSSGLTIAEIQTVINKLGSSCEAFTVPCATMPSDQFATIASAFAESGILALIVFSTGLGTDQHVVTSCGYTLNTDEWHPHGVSAYSGHSSVPFYSSALWTDHLIVHDDNFGPYYTLTLSNRALEMSPTVRASWIVALAPKGLAVSPVAAQACAAISVMVALQTMTGSGQWFDYLRRGIKLVHRITLVKRPDYLNHLATDGHNGTRLSMSEINLFDVLPDYFWMVEFSTVELFTGNHAKLGEVAVDAQNGNFSHPLNTILSMRLPSLVAIPQGPPGLFDEYPVAANSHMPILRQVDHKSIW